MKKLTSGVLVMVFVVLGAACNRNEGPQKPDIPAAFTFRGDVRLSGSKYVFGGLDNCAGVGPYSDIYTGAFVTVTNQVGKPIAIGKVEFGLGTNYYQDVLDECTFRIVVANVPQARAYYVVLARLAAHPFTLRDVVDVNGRITFDANPPLVREQAPL